MSSFYNWFNTGLPLKFIRLRNTLFNTDCGKNGKRVFYFLLKTEQTFCCFSVTKLCPTLCDPMNSMNELLGQSNNISQITFEKV